MLQYLVKRALLAIPTMFAVSVLVFVILHLVPGDPAAIFIGDRPATPERLAQIRHVMGLDRPLLIQYGDFLQRLGRGALGRPIHSNTSVLAATLTRIGSSPELGLTSVAISVSLRLGPGLISAPRRG